MENKKFVEREWNESIKGELDEEGFFYTPNGSFWDPDYVYFNGDGFDKHGGYYDEQMEYIPGEGWDEINMCYFDDEDDDNDDDERYNKHSIDFDGDFDYEGDDDVLEGETGEYVNEPDIETIQIPAKNSNKNNKRNGMNNNNNNGYNKKDNKRNIKFK